MKNKKFLIILACILIGLFVLYLLASQKSPSDQDSIPDQELTNEEVQIKKQAQAAINAWGNFSDNTSSEYLESIRPYLTKEAYDQQAEISQSQKQLNEQFGTHSQKYTIKKISLVDRAEDANSLTYKIEATREFADQKQDSITYIHYTKVDDDWKIFSIESD